VRGKLVPQDADDEPASELLKRIAAEKARLVKAGEIRKPRDLDNSGERDALFRIPATWLWVRLDTVGAIVGGGTPSATDLDNFTEPGEGIPWLTPADLGGYSDLHISHGARDLSEKGLRGSSATLMPKGTVLFTSRAPIGYVAIASNPISTNQGFKSILPYVADCSRYIAMVMHAFAPEINAKAPGTTFKEVSGKIVAAISFPLPPLAEQHRIVAKVDELMALCDRLEAARAEREATRDRFTAASLARLNAPDPDTFRDDAHFAVEALPALTARADRIKHLRQTILNLAVRGKLVPQDPNDEPASELLKRIAEDKARLVKDREIRQRDIQPSIASEDAPFSPPSSWVWTRLGTLCFLITDGAHHTPKYQDEGVPFLSVKDVSGGTIDFSNTRFISEEAHRELAKRCNPEMGDILLTKVGTTGIAVEVETDREFSIFVSLALLKFSHENIDRRFLCHLINSPFVKRQSADNTQGIGNKNLVLRLINQFVIPLPPLAEQRRIVSKVDELMALCDRLEASLAAADENRHRLLEALLTEALAPEEERELEAAE
jgi:type I restriction enzyme, S subunit